MVPKGESDRVCEFQGELGGSWRSFGLGFIGSCTCVTLFAPNSIPYLLNALCASFICVVKLKLRWS